MDATTGTITLKGYVVVDPGGLFYTKEICGYTSNFDIAARFNLAEAKAVVSALPGLVYFPIASVG